MSLITVDQKPYGMTMPAGFSIGETPQDDLDIATEQSIDDFLTLYEERLDSALQKTITIKVPNPDDPKTPKELHFQQSIGFSEDGSSVLYALNSTEHPTAQLMVQKSYAELKAEYAIYRKLTPAKLRKEFPAPKLHSFAPLIFDLPAELIEFFIVKTVAPAQRQFYHLPPVIDEPVEEEEEENDEKEA